MRSALLSAALAAVIAMFAYVAPAEAQAIRTWVSGVGDDVNPCSRTAPCKTFAGAISKTAAGGEISVLDPGGFGAVTIAKSISIVATGAEGGVLSAGTTGIIINAQPGDVVSLSGLYIDGGGTGQNGVRILGGGQVTIRQCMIRGSQAAETSAGIAVEPAAGRTNVFVTDTMISKNSVGIRVKPAANASADVTLDRVQVVQNGGVGIGVDGAAATVRLNNSTIAYNGMGLSSANSGQIISFGNNAITANGPDGAQNGAPTAKGAMQ